MSAILDFTITAIPWKFQLGIHPDLIKYGLDNISAKFGAFARNWTKISLRAPTTGWNLETMGWNVWNVQFFGTMETMELSLHYIYRVAKSDVNKRWTFLPCPNASYTVSSLSASNLQQLQVAVGLQYLLPVASCQNGSMLCPSMQESEWCK